MPVCNSFPYPKVILVLATLTTTLATAAAPGDPQGPATEENNIFYLTQDGEIVGTGAKRPSPEQWAWGERHMVKAAQVRPNALGLSRVNRARAERGQAPLDYLQAGVVPVGGETQATSTPGEPLTAEALPGYVDNSTLACFPPIGNQGALNSCGQFAGVYYALTHMTALARNWNAATGGDNYRFSPKWTYNTVNGGENIGSWHYDAYAIAQNHGVATWAEFPYDQDYRSWCMNSTVWRNAIYRRADQAGKVVDVETDVGLSQLKQFLVNGYVLNFATYIGSWQWGSIADDAATSTDDGFVGKPCVYEVTGTSGGHAMTIVGYNDDLWVDLNNDGTVTPDEKGALRIANSWGTGWGESGFCWLAYNALRTRNAGLSTEGAFWYDEATWVTARASYQPQLLAQFTLTHLMRNQLLAFLGTSETTAATPDIEARWFPEWVLNYAGGPWAFNGTTVAVDGTFYLDFTDLLPTAAGMKRYHLGMRDGTPGEPATLKSYKLLDLVQGREIVCFSGPQQTDASQVFAHVDYDFGVGTMSPVAVTTASLTSGEAPLYVVLDGSGSYDTDGRIVSCTWDPGDGTGTWTGNPFSRIYFEPGTYTASLTVTDNAGAQGSTTVIITVSEPNVLAPSGLTASVSGKTVTLRWNDNSNNEQGFYIERAPRSGNRIFTRIGQVGAGATSYVNSSVSSGQYLYRVQAFNNALSSDYSSVVSVRVR